VASGLVGQFAPRLRALVSLLRTAWTEYEHDRAIYLAAAMIYYALISLIPVLVLSLSALGLLLTHWSLAAEVQQHILNYVESTFGAELRQTIEESLMSFKQSSLIAAIVGLIGLVFTASVLFRHLRLSFRALWKYAPVRVSGSVRVVVQATLRERVVAFVMVFLGGVLFLIALVLEELTRWLDAQVSAWPLLYQTTGWLLAELSPLLLAAITFASLFKFLPPARLGWRDIRLATVLCAVGWGVATKVLSLYGLFFGGSPSAYGAIGGLLVAMLWMNVMSQMLFIGGELCKVVATQAAGTVDAHAGT
jgi:membrane protein